MIYQRIPQQACHYDGGQIHLMSELNEYIPHFIRSCARVLFLNLMHCPFIIMFLFKSLIIYNITFFR